MYDWVKHEALLYANEQFFKGKINTRISNDTCYIRLSVSCGVKEIELGSCGSDFFNTLIDIRKELEKDNYIICCNGTRKNFYPSNMSLQMSKGKVGYLLEFGVRASNKARTFDLCDKLECMSTVSSQLAFFKKWKESIGIFD